MKWKIIIPAAAVAAIAVVALSLAMTSNNSPAAPGASAAAPAASGAQGQGQAVLPVSSNPITNTSTAPGLVMVSAAVENNVDPVTKQPTPDRLQVELRNTSSNTLTGFEIYYTMTDTTTKKTESYYLPLTGLSLAAHATTSVYFDNQQGTNHYPENKFSIYRSSTNQVDFSVEVSAQNVAPAKGTAVKGAGTGEVAGG